MHRTWLAVLTTVLIVVPCGATTIRVDVNGGGDYLSISEGIAAASAGDTVLVAPGIYSGELNRNMGLSQGKVVRSDAGREETVVDCEYQGRAFSMNGDAILDGFTITHGQHDEGSAIYVGFSAANVRNCLITENSGTAMECIDPDGPGWILVDNTVFEGNGTGIHSLAYLWVVDCDFIGNSGTGIATYGEWSVSSVANVARSRFHGNGGAGVGSHLSSGLISWSVFTENGNGAVSVSEGWNNVDRCTIVRNYSSMGAAVYAAGHHHGGGPTISNSIIAFNECVGAIEGCYETTVTHNIVFGNAGGDSLCGYYYDNLFDDPRLCDVMGGDVSPCEDSPAISWGVGAYEEPGCGPCQTPIARSTWGRLKALYR
jgi:hypothetical protein